MSVAVRLMLFLVVVAAAFGVGAALGAAVPDLSSGDDPPADHSDPVDHEREDP